MNKNPNCLRMADGGETLITRWANKLVGNNPKAMVQRGRSETQDAAYVPPQPAPVQAQAPTLRFSEGGAYGGFAQGEADIPRNDLGSVFNQAQFQPGAGTFQAPAAVAPVAKKRGSGIMMSMPAPVSLASEGPTAPLHDPFRMRNGGELRMQSGGTQPQPAPLPPQTPIPDFMRRDQFSTGGEDNEYQDGMGGRVPGKPNGDTHNALYEGGEFVVSNDMLKKAPGLREQLRELREETLEGQGKTVAEADAGQMKGGTLRAQYGVAPYVNHRPPNGPPMMQPPLLLGNDVPPQRALATQPYRPNFTMGGTPPPAAAAGPAAPPYTPPRVDPATGKYVNSAAPAAPAAAPAAPKSLPFQAGKVVGDVLRNPYVRFAGNAAGAAGAIYEGTGAVTEAQAGNYAGAADKGLRSVASAAAGKGNLPAMAYLGGAMVGDRVYNNMDDIQKDGVGSIINKGVRAAGAAVGQDWGVDDAAMNSLRNYDMSSSVPARREGAPAADAAKPGTVAPTTYATPDASVRNLRQGNYDVPAGEFGPEDGVVYRKGTSFSGRNVSGYTGKNPIGVIPGMPQAEIDKALTNPDGSRWSANDNAIMAANLRDGVDPYRGTSRQAGENAAAKQAELERLAASPLGTVGRTNAQKTLAQNLQSNTLRQNNADTIAQRDREALMSARTAAADRKLRAEQFGITDGRAQEAHDQTVGTKALEGLNKEFRVFKDGKEDEEGSSQLQTAIRQIFPGIDSMNVQDRNRVLPDAKEMAGIFAKARAQDKVGWDALKFWEAKRSPLSAMPNATGGKTQQVGPFEGLVMLNGDNGDTLLETKDGRTLNLGKLTDRQRELVERAKTQGWGK